MNQSFSIGCEPLSAFVGVAARLSRGGAFDGCVRMNSWSATRALSTAADQPATECPRSTESEKQEFNMLTLGCSFGSRARRETNMQPAAFSNNTSFNIQQAHATEPSATLHAVQIA
jgi:hypothetical protein